MSHEAFRVTLRRASVDAAILGSKLFRLNRNATILCGVATGVISGYQFTQGFLLANIARLEQEKARLDKQAAEQDPITAL
ncbi:hypothetical protein TRAPUB_588 [Trametes pubescens]|uniref:Uncharacterized protein n=1 Tax=Trametes pubescens TaxID=154538 RepID=A0A1M2VLM4_TRAPU|nr:hypothetical protein TRAPUB_588 [Trametes pubescens]